MRTLDINWVTSGLIDFEYKKYELLAYLQSVKSRFDQYHLYPDLSDLIHHFQHTKDLKANKESMELLFPKKLSVVDFENLQLVYAKMIEDDELMQEIEHIIEYALPQMEVHMKVGKEVYDFIEKHLEINSVGVTPLYKDAGYLFLEQPYNPDYQVYQYQVTLFEKKAEKYRGVYMQYIGKFQRSLANTLESIKLSLLRSFPALPNPATYVVLSKIEVPYEEALLPMAKRLLVRHIAA